MLKIAFALVLPIVVFFGGVWIMSVLTGRQSVQRRLAGVADADRKPLNERFGYGLNDVDRHWDALANDPRARSSEQRFLEMDLLFPFFYGAALAASLLMLWALLGRPFNPALLLAPVVITLLADWTENLIQIHQFGRYVDAGKQGLSEGWIRVASVATILKLGFFAVSSLLVGAIAIAVVTSWITRKRKKRVSTDEGASPGNPLQMP